MTSRHPAWWALAMLAAAVPAHAQTKTGTALGQFLLIEPSARVAGMGNAGASLGDGLEGAYYNPAAIGRARRFGATFTHSAWLADIRYDYVAAAMPLGGWGNVYGSVTALNSGDMDVRTVQQPLGTGERFRVSDMALGLGYGRQISERFAAGIQLTWLQETIWHSTASAAVLNVGTLYRLAPNGLHIGASISNFGTRSRFDGRDLRFVYDNDPDRYGDNSSLPASRFADDFPVPVLFRVGVGLPVRLDQENTLRFALDASHPSDNSESVNLGGEWTFRDVVSLRAGYQSLFQQDSEEGLTMGAGVHGRLEAYDYRVDVAWADHGRLGSAQRLTVGLDF